MSESRLLICIYLCGLQSRACKVGLANVLKLVALLGGDGAQRVQLGVPLNAAQYTSSDDNSCRRLMTQL